MNKVLKFLNLLFSFPNLNFFLPDGRSMYNTTHIHSDFPAAPRTFPGSYDPRDITGGLPGCPQDYFGTILAMILGILPGDLPGSPPGASTGGPSLHKSLQGFPPGTLPRVSQELSLQPPRRRLPGEARCGADNNFEIISKR